MVVLLRSGEMSGCVCVWEWVCAREHEIRYVLHVVVWLKEHVDE